jgi:hypothetical protein
MELGQDRVQWRVLVAAVLKRQAVTTKSVRVAETDTARVLLRLIKEEVSK